MLVFGPFGIKFKYLNHILRVQVADSTVTKLSLD